MQDVQATYRELKAKSLEPLTVAIIADIREALSKQKARRDSARVQGAPFKADQGHGYASAGGF